jgi:hypothetical protein
MTSDTSCSLHIVFYFDEGVEGVGEEEGVMDFLALVQDSLPFPTYAEIEEPHEVRAGHTVYLTYLAVPDLH